MGKFNDQMKQIEEIVKILYDDSISKVESNVYDRNTDLELGSLMRTFVLMSETIQRLCEIEDFKKHKLLMDNLMKHAKDGAKKVGALEYRLNDAWIKNLDSNYTEIFLKIKTIYSQKR